MDVNRIIGALEAQGRHTDARLNRIETKLDGLNRFEAKVLGIAGAAAFLATLLVEFIRTR